MIRALGFLFLVASVFAQTLPLIPAPAVTLDTSGTITAPANTNLTLNGGSSGASITIEDSNPGRILLRPLQPVNASYLDMVDALGTVSGTFLGDTFLGRYSLVASNATVNNHSAAIVGEFRSTGTTTATQYVAGLYGVVHQQSSAALSEANGNISVLDINGNGNITEATAYRSSMAMETGTGRMVTVRNFYGTGMTRTSGAAIPTTLVAFDAADMGAAGVQATNVYAFRSAGDTPSLLAGPVEVGSLTTPGAIISTYTLASSSSTTGAIKTAGGLGVAKDIYGGAGLFLPGTSNTAANGVNFGTSNEAMFRNGAGSLKITGGGALTIDLDVRANTTATYDLGTSSVRWRQLFTSGLASVGLLGVQTGGTNLFTAQATTATARVYNSGTYGWSSTGASDSGSYDTCLGRLGAGAIEITNCTANTYRSLTVSQISFGGSGATTSSLLTNFGNALLPRNGASGKPTVGSLTACSASGEGAYTVVTDALAPAVGVTVAAGGAAKAMVWCNGANWTVMGI